MLEGQLARQISVLDLYKTCHSARDLSPTSLTSLFQGVRFSSSNLESIHDDSQNVNMLTGERWGAWASRLRPPALASTDNGWSSYYDVCSVNLSTPCFWSQGQSSVGQTPSEDDYFSRPPDVICNPYELEDSRGRMVVVAEDCECAADSTVPGEHIISVSPVLCACIDARRCLEEHAPADPRRRLLCFLRGSY